MVCVSPALLTQRYPEKEHSGVLGDVVGSSGEAVGSTTEVQSSTRMSTPFRHLVPLAAGMGFDHSTLLQSVYHSVQLPETGTPTDEVHRMNRDPSQLSTVHAIGHDTTVRQNNRKQKQIQHKHLQLLV